MKYLDALNGLWEYRESMGSRHWLLLSFTGKHIMAGIETGKYYDDETVGSFGIGDFVSIECGETYNFSPLRSGMSIWVNAEWFENDGVSLVEDYVGSPGRFGGVFEKSLTDNPGWATIMIRLTAPLEMITRK